MIRQWIDPPEGWKYGFPKPMSNDLKYDHTHGVEEWLIDEGYPRELAVKYRGHVRSWFEDDDKEAL